MKHYTINEVFHSLQGEGVRAGTANVFVRFTGCNMQCALEANEKSPGGFDCDTEFVSGARLTLEELLARIEALTTDTKWLVLTGGEPGLQVDAAFCDFFHERGYKLAIETNGSVRLPQLGGSVENGVQARDYDSVAEALAGYLLDWITVSPKVAEHAVRQCVAHEVKYVRGYGQELVKKPACAALNYLVSPCFEGTNLDRTSLKWCESLVKANPEWRLSVQQHKYWSVR